MADEIKDVEILILATRFRDALDKVDSEVWQSHYIDSFPRGACGHCSEMLGRFLFNKISIEPEYVCAVFYDADGNRKTSHAWLEWRGLTIDITGDQFGLEPVIVKRQSAWHAAGEVDTRHGISDDHSWFAINCGRIWSAASAILSALDKPT
jgi:hypothetical protein